jgi:hypothetical protein
MGCKQPTTPNTTKGNHHVDEFIEMEEEEEEEVDEPEVDEGGSQSAA